jgi:2-amino-4-hydroxy-6-hydroxymethyldihydropteridine diphosphokinase
MSIAYLLSGSNQGERSEYLQKAVLHLSDLAGEVTKCSPLFESPAWGFEHPSPFLNQAVELKTMLSPEELLEAILGIEAACGRVRNGAGGYEARTLDIDILFYDNVIINTPKLSIPHPRLHLRRFALLPLSFIAGEADHPGLGKSVTELLTECTDTSRVEIFEYSCCNCSKEKEGTA